MAKKEKYDNQLPKWTEIDQQEDWASLVLGNGFSQNTWKKFGYKSLLETASSDDIKNPLTKEDIDLFQKLQTQDFEMVLAALSTSSMVCDIFQIEHQVLTERYDSIQKALIQAVHFVHIPWKTIPEHNLVETANILSNYKSIFSTNYDLLVYWSIMKSPDKFKDYLWSEVFDLGDTDIWGNVTRVLYLHGGLHLYKYPNGETVKRMAQPYENLLDLFGTEFDGAHPLFVSEGNAEQKKSAIFRSEYLSFAYTEFTKDEGPAVVFGHSLGDMDSHIVAALNLRHGRPIAVAIPPWEQEIVKRKHEIAATLPHSKLYFFDSTSHPLGNEDFLVAE